MEKIIKYIIVCILAWVFAACENQAAPEPIDGDEAEVQFYIGGTYGHPFMPSSRAEDPLNGFTDYDTNLSTRTPEKLPEGSTLWLLLEKLPTATDSTSTTTFTEGSILKSFVVDNNGLLMPCAADDMGNCVEKTTKPLYLTRGQWYRARVIGPARKLEDNYSMYITNNQYVYAHDYRYPQYTKYSVFYIDYDSAVETVYLKPVIHQNAELKFTIVAEKVTVPGTTEVFTPVHSLEVMPAGVVVTGLQEHYSLNGTDGEGHIIGEPYNWTLGENYLIAFPGHVNNYMTIYEPYEVKSDPPTLVFKGAIMPTDAVANPIIVGFYLRVNGVPTMFQMMLNRKMFLHAYYYHYIGTIKIQSGIAVMEWQTVAREQTGELNIIDQ